MDKNARKIGVWGGTGSGKSTRVKELTAKNNRLIVIDPIGDYEREGGFTGYKTLRGLYTAMKKNWNKGFRLVLTVPRGTDPKAQLEQLANDLFLIQKPYYEGKDNRIITLVIEEMSICYPEKTLGASERSVLELINLGRHYGIEIIGVSQRIAEVKKNFVGNASEHYFFRMGAAVDNNAALRLIGNDHKAAIQSLQNHHYIHFCQGQVSKGKNKCDFK